MSRKWVVVSEDSFNQLCDKLTNNIGPTDSNKPEPSLIADPQNPQPEPTNPIDPNPALPLDHPNQPEQPLKENSDNILENSAKEPSERDLETLVPGHKWVSELPPSYRREGLRLLKLLNEAGGFNVDLDGVVSIDNNLIENYNITKFLRTTCVPFHKGEIPLPLQKWLKMKKITKFRNHLVTMRPDWVKRYSWRRSTTENPQEPLEDL